MRNITSRKILLTAFLLCILLFIVAYWVQEKYGLAPCPLCMLQRIIVGLIALLAFIGAIHNPGRIGAKIYGILGTIFAVVGLGLAGRQIWLQHQPPSSTATCLPGLKYLFQSMPSGQALKAILHGSTECSRVRWEFIFTLPEWSAIAFIILCVLMLLLFFVRRKTKLEQNI